MDIIQLSSSQVPYYQVGSGGAIIDDDDPFWRGKRLRICYTPASFKTLSIDKPIGIIEEGQSYPFDGHEVRHVKFEGKVLPDGLTMLFNRVCMDDGSLFVNPTDSSYYDIPYVPYALYQQTCRFLVVRSFMVGSDLQVTWWLYDRNITYPTSRAGDYYRSYYRGIVYDLSTGLHNVLSDSSVVFIPQFTSSTNPQQWAVDWATRNIQAFESFIATRARSLRYTATRSIAWNYFHFDGLRTVDLTYQYHKFQQIARRYLKEYPWTIIEEYGSGELARLCVQGQHSFDGNLLNWADKLTDWGGGLKSILNTIENPLDRKAWASAWLSNRFGDRLEYNTSIDLLDAVWDKFLTIPLPSKYSGYNVTRASLSAPFGGGQLSRRMRLVCSNDSVSKLMTAIKKFMDWDAWPSLENTFDLIPLSFVVDWFTNLSIILDNVDQMVYRQYLKCELCENIARLEIPVRFRTDRVGISYHFEGKVILFSRKGSKILPEFGILEGWDPRLPSLFNIVDGASLLCQFLT